MYRLRPRPQCSAASRVKIPVSSLSCAFRKPVTSKTLPNGLNMRSVCVSKGLRRLDGSKSQGIAVNSGMGRKHFRVEAMFEKFTERSVRSVSLAQKEAASMNVAEIGTGHILLGIFAEAEERWTSKGYLNTGLSVEPIRRKVAAASRWKTQLDPGQSMQFSSGVARLFMFASHECKRSHLTFITPEHIVLALLSTVASEGVRILDSLNVDLDMLRQEALKKLKEEHEPGPSYRKSLGTEEGKGSDGPPLLPDLCVDLCAAARVGDVDPVIGRDAEVSRVIQILARRSKNNPVLLGDAGVGKTAIAEGLARAIVAERCPDSTPLPDFLRGKRVMQLDVSRIIAGAKERGEVERRVTMLIKEAKQSKDVILMIDEVHTMVGAGATGRSKGGGLDVSNMMKPALARGDVQVIGATTVKEYRKHIESDAALERRFQPVHVGEPSREQALLILQGLREHYERHHRVIFSEEALEAAVDLSTKYIADRYLPDKAIDLMDEAGSRVRIEGFAARRDSMSGQDNPRLREYLQVSEAKGAAVKESLFEEATILHRRETDFRVELSGPASSGCCLPVVGRAEIEHIVSSWTGVPVTQLDSNVKHQLLTLPARLKARVVGQEDAVDGLCAAIARARCGLSSPRRPLASFLLLGPTGVGKTEVVKVLAEQYLGDRSAMIRLDMSEYMERHSVSKLIGAPPGYAGYDEGGGLTEAIRRRPHSIVLLDEVEKAHPEVLSVLLQILEDGRLVSSQGRAVSFKNAVVVMTSNIGSRYVVSAGRAGLMALSPRVTNVEEEAEAEARRHARVQSMVLDEVKQYFKPELINRIDEQVVFHRLRGSDVQDIAMLMIRETQRRVEEKGLELQVSESLMSLIVKEGYSDEYGARPLRRTIARLVEDPLCDELLLGDLPPGTHLLADLDMQTGTPLIRRLSQPHAPPPPPVQTQIIENPRGGWPAAPQLPQLSSLFSGQ